MGTSPDENEVKNKVIEQFREGGLVYRKHAGSLEAAGYPELAAEARWIAEQSNFYVMLLESDLYREDARNHLIVGQITERALALDVALTEVGWIGETDPHDEAMRHAIDSVRCTLETALDEHDEGSLTVEELIEQVILCRDRLGELAFGEWPVGQDDEDDE